MKLAPPLLLSPFALAELDYLLMRHVGLAAQKAVLDEVANGAYQLEPFGADECERAARIVGKYADLNLGLADASIIVLADRHDVGRIPTLDERHFRAVQFGRSRRFALLPFR